MLVILLLVSGLTVFGHEMTPFGADIIQQLSQMRDLESTCLNEAIHVYIKECWEKGPENVDAKLRLQLAVRLSICEFEEAHVDYPDSCTDLDKESDYQKCVSDFRKVSQLWTTYSGHYRKLRTMCLEEGLPFARSSIIDLFLNITRMYSNMYRDGVSSLHEFESMRGEILAKYLRLQDMMEKVMGRTEEQQRKFMRRFEDFEEAFFTKADAAQECWGQAVDEMLAQALQMSQNLFSSGEKIGLWTRILDGSVQHLQETERALASKRDALDVAVSLQVEESLSVLQLRASSLGSLLEAGFDRLFQMSQSLENASHLARSSVEESEQAVRAILTGSLERFQLELSEIVDAKVQQLTRQALNASDSVETSMRLIAQLLVDQKSVSDDMKGVLAKLKEESLFSLLHSVRSLVYTGLLVILFLTLTWALRAASGKMFPSVVLGVLVALYLRTVLGW